MMRVFTLSDIHIDYPQNKEWLFSLSTSDYRDDVLILAGDITDNLLALEKCFRYLAAIFSTVLYVPGNHELWVVRGEIECSLKKFEAIHDLALDCNIAMEPRYFDKLSIVPLFAWYDFSFGEPSEKLNHIWADFKHCAWPDNYEVADITAYFLKKNRAAIMEQNEMTISFSHFLPSLKIMPSNIPTHYQFLHPVLGSKALGHQVDQLQPDIHVYGHSHINRDVKLNGIRYINNAFGYPAEFWPKKELLCIYEN